MVLENIMQISSWSVNLSVYLSQPSSSRSFLVSKRLPSTVSRQIWELLTTLCGSRLSSRQLSSSRRTLRGGQQDILTEIWDICWTTKQEEDKEHNGHVTTLKHLDCVLVFLWPPPFSHYLLDTEACYIPSVTPPLSNYLKVTSSISEIKTNNKSTMHIL